MSLKNYIPTAKELCKTYSESIQRFSYNLNNSFNKAVNLILSSKGHIVVCGMGKSGHIGRKISATLASTGSPSFFLHPAEAIHGDLGMVKNNDVIILISYSGETEEIIKLLGPLKKLNVHIISLTSKSNSTLGLCSEICLDISIDREACPLNLAPTTSSLLTMTSGDALAIAAMQARGFAEEDFALTHPGGSLGKSLTETVEDKMITKNLPLISKNDFMKEAIIIMTESRLGLAIVHENNELIGIITDGDLRRLLLNNNDLMSTKVGSIMTKNPITIHEKILMAEAKSKMVESKIQALIVTNTNKKIVGVVQIY